MCGICGQYNFGDQAPVLRQDIEKMARSIAHRGPDDEGYHIAGPLGLGFRRLSIIDLEGGHQPMSDREESVWVVFNGEIYNFPELRRELEGYGYVFRTECDTEVIVHGYKRWGEEVFNHLNGMFGLAIWDARQKRLLLARDRFGIKLVYYKLDAGRLYFGSEIRAVVAAANEGPSVDPSSLNLFIRYRYTPSPYTIFENVRKLAPGTMLTCEKGTCSVRRWYNYRPAPFSPMKSVGEAQEELVGLYKQSVKRHLLSDVPLGLLLSGGVDFASEHAEVKLDRKTFEDVLPKIVASLEEPVASASIVPMYFVCQRARQDVKVALMGQGPDELFGGYRRHLGVRYGAMWVGLPRWLRKRVSSVIGALPRNETLKRGVYSLEVSERLKRYQHVLSLLPGNQIDGLFQEGLLGPDPGDKILACWQDLAGLMTETDELGGFQFLELRSTLPDELLMYADKLSMAHGLEVRVPYLDKDIVEYVERLSADFKVRNGSQKRLHRRVCQTFLPKTILRRMKRGFAVNVVDDWFRNTMRNKMEEILLDRESKINDYVRPSAVREMLKQHQSGQSDNHKVLFSLLVFEQWIRVHGSHPEIAA